MPKHRIPTWALAWLTGLAVVAVIFLANTGAVDRLMDAVGLTRVLYPNKSQLASNVIRQDSPASPLSAQINLEQAPPGPALPLAAQIPADPSVRASEPSTILPNAAVPSSQVPALSVSPVSSPTSSPALTSAPPDPGVSGTGASAPSPTSAQEPLFFLKMGPDGRLEPTPFVRQVVAGNTPLTAALQALLMGPTLFEKSAGAISLIPEGTRLLSVRVENGTAFLSFSDEFAHNVLGLEGLAGQLKEVVWTATQFPSVQRVQILINGQYSSAHSVDGLSMALPLDRSNLR
ncbi:MAG: GerMN domain-containing protein [Spirochaetales bacterium]|nr:GerMN domain-containing protein [Spirochaetales bacterium]